MIGEAGAATAMGKDQIIVQLVAKLPGHAGADHHVKQVRKPASAGEGQRLVVAIAEASQELLVGADNPVTTVAVAQGNRNQPVDAAVLRHGLIGGPANVIGGIANVKHRVKQQIQLTTAGPHEKVGAADGTGE